jgi:hypothetical protein
MRSSPMRMETITLTSFRGSAWEALATVTPITFRP